MLHTSCILWLTIRCVCTPIIIFIFIIIILITLVLVPSKDLLPFFDSALHHQLILALARPGSATPYLSIQPSHDFTVIALLPTQYMPERR